MNLEKILLETKEKKYTVVNKDDLDYFINNSELLIEKDTLISDKIRLLKFQELLYILEKSNKDEILIRLMNTKEEAEDFINKRMETYDKMWDGCGCKVEYYS